METLRTADLSGSFGWFHLADVLQVAGYSKFPAKITIFEGCEVVSNIFVLGDQVVDAVAGGVSSPDALYRAFNVKAHGRFSIKRMKVLAGSHSMGSVTSLILDYSCRRDESNPDLNEDGTEQGVGRTPLGEIFFEGSLSGYRLEDFIPILVRPGRASLVTISLDGHPVGTITFIGDYVGPCTYYHHHGAMAFNYLLYDVPSSSFFHVRRIPIDQVQDSMLIGPVNHMLISSQVFRDETDHGVVPGAAPDNGAVIPDSNQMEFPSGPDTSSESQQELLDNNFKMATQFLIQRRLPEAEVLLTFILSINPDMDRARRALDRVMEHRARQTPLIESRPIGMRVQRAVGTLHPGASAQIWIHGEEEFGRREA